MLCTGTVCAAMPAAADEFLPRVTAAGVAGAFAARGELNDAELRAVSGLGAKTAVEANAPPPGDVSVILFDELGRPKRNGLSPGSGVNSTVARGVNVEVR